jgi:hypothetical protein
MCCDSVGHWHDWRVDRRWRCGDGGGRSGGEIGWVPLCRLPPVAICGLKDDGLIDCVGVVDLNIASP